MRLPVAGFAVLMLAACGSGDAPTESQAEAEALNQAAEALDAQAVPPVVLTNQAAK